jgi:hypothetical protein
MADLACYLGAYKEEGRPGDEVSTVPVASLEHLIQDTAQELVRLLGLRSCWFELFPFDTQLPRIEPGRVVLPAAEPAVEPWAVDRGVELPVRYDGLTVGRFVLVPVMPNVGIGLSPTGRAEAVRIAERIGTVVAAALIA